MMEKVESDNINTTASLSAQVTNQSGPSEPMDAPADKPAETSEVPEIEQAMDDLQTEQVLETPQVAEAIEAEKTEEAVQLREEVRNTETDKEQEETEDTTKKKTNFFKGLLKGIKAIPSKTKRGAKKVMTTSAKIYKIATCSNMDSNLLVPEENTATEERRMTVVEEAVLQTQLCLEEMDQRVQENSTPSDNVDPALLADVLEFIASLENVIKQTNTKTSELSLPFVLIHTMKTSSTLCKKSLSKVEEKLYTDITTKSHRNLLISGIVVKYIISRSFEPSTYIRYWLSKSVEFEAAYTSLYQATLESLTAEIPESLRSKFGVFVLNRVISVIKKQIIKKLENVKLPRNQHPNLEVSFKTPVFENGLRITNEVNTFLQNENGEKDPLEITASKLADVPEHPAPKSKPSKKEIASLKSTGPASPEESDEFNVYIPSKASELFNEGEESTKKATPEEIQDVKQRILSLYFDCEELNLTEYTKSMENLRLIINKHSIARTTSKSNKHVNLTEQTKSMDNLRLIISKHSANRTSSKASKYVNTLINTLVPETQKAPSACAQSEKTTSDNA
ncbi:hypothetical protein NEAUS03_1074 [Nematocida ausubeli]|nr:hypothetical protein NEAUS03_1074 [Nematocida ausubeli]